MSYAFVQAVEAKDSTGATFSSIGVSITPTAGNFLMIFNGRAGSSTLTLADNLGGGGSSNTYLNAVADKGNAGGTQTCQLNYVENCKGVATTITSTFGTARAYPIIRVIEYSGLATSGSLINATGLEVVTPGTGTNAISSGNININAVPAMFFGICIDETLTDGTVVANTAFTRRAQSLSMFGYPCGAEGDLRYPSTNAAVPALFTDTTSGGGDNYVAFGAAFKEATAGAGGAFPSARKRRIFLPVTFSH